MRARIAASNASNVPKYLAALVLCVLLAACVGSISGGDSSQPPTADVSGNEDSTSDADKAPATAADDSQAGNADVEIDYGCDSDTQCAIKDIGSCCGYRPACVNVDSPTDPAGVKAACERDGRMSICGFPAITGCQCVGNRCEGITGPSLRGATQGDK
ncbi:MAG: hypothetical protein R3F22_10665 [Lysobacteraceae bacterium]